MNKLLTRGQYGLETYLHYELALVTNQKADVTNIIVTDQKLQESKLESRLLECLYHYQPFT